MSRAIFKSTSVVGLTTLLSRITGLLRDMVYSQAFGAGTLMDAFLVAFKIPNFLRRLFADRLEIPLIDELLVEEHGKHPIVQRHFREALQKLIRAVPDLGYMSLWTNDSGAGFEHTASLYVGRNGGPYMIREWRNHDKVAEAAGHGIARVLRNLQQGAAEINPHFDVILRIEPFKVEHDHIKAGMGRHVGYETPSLLVRGYSLPYPHPTKKA